MRDSYFVKALVAIRMRVVPVMSLSIVNHSLCQFLCLTADAPVSTIPAVVDRMVVVPYSMDSLIPQNSFEGEVLVIGLCNLNLKSSYKQVEKSVRESDRACEFGAVGSTCRNF